jgi:calcineurin-like phosphoesterase family protein
MVVMNTYFTSDLHLGHRLVAEHRGFGDDVAEHDATLAVRWISTVDPEDVVWVLGDISVTRPEAALASMSTWPGRKRLVLGNHDKAHPMYRDAFKWMPKYLEVFEYVAASQRIRIEGQEVLLSHFPYERDRGEPRYTQWRLRNEGLPLLHGHTHSKERLADGWGEGGSWEVHVGVDAWDMTPVALGQVAEYLSA